MKEELMDSLDNILCHRAFESAEEILSLMDELLYVDWIDDEILLTGADNNGFVIAQLKLNGTYHCHSIAVS